MSGFDLQRLHRATRVVLDLGLEQNLAKAEQYLCGLRVQVVLGPSVAASEALQVAALTAVNAGVRTFLGGVSVVGAHGVPARTRLVTNADIGEGAASLGATLLAEARTDTATIVIGQDARWPRSVPLAVRLQVEDWTAAVRPADDEPNLTNESRLPLTGVLAAAMALSECFSAQLRLHPEAGHREIGVSLWQGVATTNLRREPAAPGPEYFPAGLSVIGLGHLGQAYLWALASLPYPRPEEVEIALQDPEFVGEENLGTCLLTNRSSIGERKTRAVSRWLEARGFKTRMIERRFSDSDRFGADDPRLVLAGVDSSKVRACLASASRDAADSLQLLDIGLGSGTLDFDELVLHSSPFGPAQVERWQAAAEREASRVSAFAETPTMLAVAGASDLDACGLLQLAGTAVGVPFVGAAAGALIIAELLRRLAGAPAIRALSLRLRDLDLSDPPVMHGTSLSPIAFARR